MNIEEALARVHAPVGMTSLIAAELLGGDKRSIRPPARVDPSRVGASLNRAKAELAKTEAAQAGCQSDAAYWGYVGQIAYWRATAAILEAAALVGPDRLPEVDPPRQYVTIMDAAAAVEDYGKRVLAAAQEAS